LSEWGTKSIILKAEEENEGRCIGKEEEYEGKRVRVEEACSTNGRLFYQRLMCLSLESYLNHH
jgi:hypothetical protein